MEKVGLLVVGCLIIPLLTSHATARDGVTMARDRCYISIGPYLMSYTGYQPDARSKGPFCVDLPASGRTLIILDVEQQSGGMGLTSDYYNELRDMEIELRIARGIDHRVDDEVSDQDTEAYLPPRKYPSGTLRLEHTFTQPGNFIGMIIARDDHGRVFVSRFPFTVGPTFNPTHYGIGALVMAAAAGFFLAYRMFTTGRNGRPSRTRLGRSSR